MVKVSVKVKKELEVYRAIGLMVSGLIVVIMMFGVLFSLFESFTEIRPHSYGSTASVAKGMVALIKWSTLGAPWVLLFSFLMYRLIKHDTDEMKVDNMIFEMTGYRWVVMLGSGILTFIYLVLMLHDVFSMKGADPTETVKALKLIQSFLRNGLWLCLYVVIGVVSIVWHRKHPMSSY